MNRKPTWREPKRITREKKKKKDKHTHHKRTGLVRKYMRWYRVIVTLFLPRLGTQFPPYPLPPQMDDDDNARSRQTKRRLLPITCR